MCTLVTVGGRALQNLSKLSVCAEIDVNPEGRSNGRGLRMPKPSEMRRRSEKARRSLAESVDITFRDVRVGGRSRLCSCLKWREVRQGSRFTRISICESDSIGFSWRWVRLVSSAKVGNVKRLRWMKLTSTCNEVSGRGNVFGSSRSVFSVLNSTITSDFS